MLQVEHLTFCYRRRETLSDISFDVNAGEIVAVLGPNGSGKSTLLRCLCQILRPQNGAVTLNGERLLSLSAEQIARKIAYVPQRLETAPFSVFDAVLLGRKPYFTWSPSPTDFQRVEEILYRLELESFAQRPLHQLSGGEVQKTALARALVQEPELLLFDEPTSALDLKNQVDILRIVRSRIRETNKMAVMSIHDLNLAVRYADRFLLLKDGRLVGNVPRDKLQPDVIEYVYGIPMEIHTLEKNLSFIIERSF
ncbi:MAG: ABC transporter ATP-binding protein [Planctomycetaceae bacterium]|jgi:iron complex transport system ATP-binding protein|nr:ABC transporter ATP-binding protein [Planctomycetaceae bacterium]